MSTYRKRSLVLNLIINLGVTGLILGIFLIFNNNRDITIKKLIQNSPVKISEDKPSTKAVAEYKVPADNPKYIEAPAIKLDKSIVLPLGLLPTNEIATPNNIYEAGWYTGSAKPGQSGATFIYAHVSSWTAKGLFYGLKYLKPGDLIYVTKGDNSVLTYQVIATMKYPYNKVDMNKVLSPINKVASGLNLMTCTGNVMPNTSEFDQRLVIFTSLINS